jgi:hypothetical protein
MAMTMLAGTYPRTPEMAMPARKKRAPIAPHLLPNTAGQVGNIMVGNGIINTGLGRKMK